MDAALFAQSLLSWTPTTFYATCAVVQAVIILVSFRLLNVDPEQNTVVGALMAAAGINIVGYFMRDTTLVGVIANIGITFGALVAISAGEALKSVMVGVLCMGVYWGAGTMLLPKTPLHIDDVGGMTKVIKQGGLQAESLDTQERDLYDKSAPPK